MKVLHFIIIVFQLCEQSNYILSVIFLLFNFLTSLCSLNLSSSSTPTMPVFTSLCYPKEWLHFKVICSDSEIFPMTVLLIHIPVLTEAALNPYFGLQFFYMYHQPTLTLFVTSIQWRHSLV